MCNENTLRAGAPGQSESVLRLGACVVGEPPDSPLAKRSPGLHFQMAAAQGPSTVVTIQVFYLHLVVMKES